MLASCDVTVSCPISSLFDAIEKPDSWCMVQSSYLYINNNLLPRENCFNKVFILLFWKKVLFLRKNRLFAKIMLPSAKVRESYIVRTRLFLKGGGESKFWLPPPEGANLKILKRGWKYGAGAGVFRREADTFPI